MFPALQSHHIKWHLKMCWNSHIRIVFFLQMSQNQRKIWRWHIFMSVSKHTSETSIKFGIGEVHTKCKQENVLWFILSNSPIPKLCAVGYFKFSNEVDLTHKLKSVFDEHLIQLSHWFEKYFPEDMEKFAWIHDPFMGKAPHRICLCRIRKSHWAVLWQDFRNKIWQHGSNRVLDISKRWISAAKC